MNSPATSRLEQPSRGSVLRWIFLVLVLAGLAVEIFLHFRLKTERPLPAPDYGAVPPFRLTEQNGNPFSSAGLRGRTWIANFLFTSCASQCPMMSERLSRLQGALPAGISIVSFSVDPGRDTPEVLKDYAERYHARAGRWYFLTGDKEEVNRLAEAFHMTRPEDPLLHSLSLVLVDGNARIRGYYDSNEAGAVARLAADARKIEQEENPGGR